jgi:hypothetical protein
VDWHRASDKWGGGRLVGGVRGRFQAMIDHVPGKSRRLIAKMGRGTMSHASARMVQQELEAWVGRALRMAGGGSHDQGDAACAAC